MANEISELKYKIENYDNEIQLLHENNEKHEKINLVEKNIDDIHDF